MGDGDIFDATKYVSVYTLLKNNEKESFTFLQAVQATRILVFLVKNSRIFGEKIKDVSKIAKHEYTKFLGSLILKNLLISSKYGYVVQYKSIFIIK